MKYFVAASLLAATVSAQISIGDIPSCALSCALSVVGADASVFQKAGCKTTPTAANVQTDPDAQKCLCTTSQFQQDFSNCAKTTGGCSQADQCKLWAASQKGCGNMGVTLPNSLAPAGCGSSSSPGTGSGSGSGSGGSSSSSANPAGKPAPTSAASSGSAQTSAPAQTSTAAGAPYGGTTVVSSGSSTPTGNATAPSGTPSYTPSSASTMVFSGAAAAFAGLVAMLTL